ncbi:hypothetical protein NDU88_003743 [Pleurodeles waltl]|uniref:Uncharacterized protein n=1 Tax=Pleurodeles waltl TaxID=8319 RepID=A0AAV7VG68_PLEWA|nr:hypothetical protein NDU88_003743 [Pleurodeles waltl]
MRSGSRNAQRDTGGKENPFLSPEASLIQTPHPPEEKLTCFSVRNLESNGFQCDLHPVMMSASDRVLASLRAVGGWAGVEGEGLPFPSLPWGDGREARGGSASAPSELQDEDVMITSSAQEHCAGGRNHYVPGTEGVNLGNVLVYLPSRMQKLYFLAFNKNADQVN